MTITEINGDPKVIYTRLQRFIKPIGREIRTFRYLYWRFSGHKYLWGIYQFLSDSNTSRLFK